jgi:DNA-binding transcriptional regulator GbsR (MarR family)
MNNPLFEFDIEADSKYVRQEEFTSFQESIQSQINEINNKIKPKVNKTKVVSPEIQAIQSHYEQNKTNQEIINNIRHKMTGIGYAINKTQNIPTSLIRMECLRLFNALTTEQRQQYFCNS